MCYEVFGLALGEETLVTSRTLFERSEFVRALPNLASTHLVRPGRASMVLPTFAETKVGRLPGRNPAPQEIFWTHMVVVQ